MPLPLVASPKGAQAVLDALIALNRVEDEAAQMKRPSPRIKDLMAKERKKLPLPILAHHDRMRSRGRKSTVAVRHDVCSGCHISIAQGLRARLRHRLDLNVCENCGSYIYLPEEERLVASMPVPSPVLETRKAVAPVASPVPLRARKSTPRLKSKKRLAMAR